MFNFSLGNCWIEQCFDTLVDLKRMEETLQFILFGSGADKDHLDLAERPFPLPNPDGVCQHHF